MNILGELTDSSSSKTACIIGIIIATAAVFEIHIDTNIVTAIKPKFNLKIPIENLSLLNYTKLMCIFFSGKQLIIVIKLDGKISLQKRK